MGEREMDFKKKWRDLRCFMGKTGSNINYGRDREI
jgi:hypothetical protein